MSTTGTRTRRQHSSKQPAIAAPIVERSLREDARGSNPMRVDRAAGVIYGVKVLGRTSPNSHGVPGVESTEYTPEAITAACALYEGVNVNANHPDRDKPGADRDMNDRIGWLSNCRVVEGELFADLNLLLTDDRSAKLFEAAERRPQLFGLSHNALGRGEVRGTKYVITEIPEVRSVDVVADAGTVNSLFESQQMTTPLREGDLTTGSDAGGKFYVYHNFKNGSTASVKQVAGPFSTQKEADSWAAQHQREFFAKTESRKGKNPMKLRTLFEAAARSKSKRQPNKARLIRRMVEALDNATADVPDEQKLMEQPAEDTAPPVEAEAAPMPPADEAAVAADPDAALAAGFRAACDAVLDDSSMALQDKLKRLKELLTTQEKLMAAPAADVSAEVADAPVAEAEEELKPEEKPVEESEEDKEKKIEESRQYKTLAARLATLEADKARAESEKAILETREAVRSQLATARLTEVTAEVFEALCAAEPKHRKTLIEQQKTIAAAQRNGGQWPPVSRSTLESEDRSKAKVEQVKDGESFAKLVTNWGRN